MEKFAVDLDKVLDEFEFNEDRAEQLVTVSKRGCNNSSTEIDGVSCQLGASQYCLPLFEAQVTNSPSNTCFNNEVNGSSSSTRKDVNSGGSSGCVKNTNEHSQSTHLCWHQDLVIQNNVSMERSPSNNKLNVSGVFSSLNEYLNAGSLNVSKKDSSEWADKNIKFNYEELSNRSNNIHNVVPSENVDGNSKFLSKMSSVNDNYVDNHSKSQFVTGSYKMETEDVKTDLVTEQGLNDRESTNPFSQMNEAQVHGTSFISSKVADNDSMLQFTQSINDSKINKNRNMCSSDDSSLKDNMGHVTNQGLEPNNEQTQDSHHLNSIDSSLRSVNNETTESLKVQMSRSDTATHSGETSYGNNDTIHGSIIQESENVSHDCNVSQPVSVLTNTDLLSLKDMDVKMSYLHMASTAHLNEPRRNLTDVDHKYSNQSCSTDCQLGSADKCSASSSSQDTRKVATVGFNNMKEFSNEELESYLQEMEEMGSNMILCNNKSDSAKVGCDMEENEGDKITDTSDHLNGVKTESSKVLSNFLKVEDLDMKNTCPEIQNLNNNAQPVESDALKLKQDADVDDSKPQIIPVKSCVGDENGRSQQLDHASNSVRKEEDVPEKHLHKSEVSSVCDTVANENGNMHLTHKNETVSNDKSSSLSNSTDDDMKNKVAVKTTEDSVNATLSINMLNTGKSTANVTNVISIECQQTKNYAKAFSGQDTSDMLEGAHLTGTKNDIEGVKQVATDSNANKIQHLTEDKVSTTEEKFTVVPATFVHKDASSSEPELLLNYTQSNEQNEDNALPENDRNVETSYSKAVVPGCLVQAPKDGSRINVLGEEERPSRPKFLFLPSKITMENQAESSDNTETVPSRPILGLPGETPVAHLGPTEEISGDISASIILETTENAVLTSPDISENSSIDVAISPVPSIQTSSPSNNESLPYILSSEERSLGKLPPFWVPDSDAPNCMLCDLKFTVLKRRHHCRACGKVLCSKCCSLKSRLEYMDNAEARVCQPCFDTLARVLLTEQGESASESPSSLAADNGSTPLGRQPNPNNPMEYCSTIPPLEQAASASPLPVPSVLVPVGVLKREGSTKSKSDVAKQVMFSDGIRPGGDLTELDGSSEPRLPCRRQERVLKRVGTPPGIPSNTSHHSALRSLMSLEPKSKSYIPSKGLPPLATLVKGEVKLEDVNHMDKLLTSLRLETEPAVMFALNRNLFVQVKILNLDCCVNRLCWCFSTMGMSSVGQDEIVIMLECLPEENTIPRDIFCHLNTIYQEASRGSMVSEMGHTMFQGPTFLGSSEHGGFIYIRPSFQCLHKLILPSAPYLVGILFHRWEIPWAKVFPIRLMLRLGAEFRYYPCMLVSIRQRKPVYCEIGHTIINLLADFRNLSYTLPSVRGLVIHMEDRHTSIMVPKNRYDQVARALNNSNDHVLALAANFSLSADSHLVCIQSHGDESYHTQAINIHNKPRKVTGASFVVFNGALKLSSNLTAKSSIVEDGLMVQITPDTIQELRTALRKMQDFSVRCGPAGAVLPDELVSIKWVQDDKNFNIGVISFIDGHGLDGVPSIRVHNGTDYMGSTRFIRWTEVFILQSGENSERTGDPLDISRLSESLARATCLALVNYLDLLAQAGLTKIAIRANIHPENVGYEAGSRGEKLPPIYMKSLDNELVPVLHKAASMAPESPPVLLELIFHVMLQ